MRDNCPVTDTRLTSLPELQQRLRSAMAAEHTTNQAVKGRRGNQRDWVKNHTISTATDTAQRTPIMVLL